MMRPRFFLLLLLAALAVLGLSPPAPARPTKTERALILNSGSTNTAGYEVSVLRTGQVEYAAGTTTRLSPPRRGRVSPKLASKFFADLAAAMPLSSLPVEHGLKSASFGTILTVEYRGQRSPDLSLPVDARGQAVRQDAMAIVRSLHLGTVGRRRLLPLRPMP